jgi:hypothetical protein
VTLAKQVLAAVPFSYALLRPAEGAWDVFARPDFPFWLASWEFVAGLPAFAVFAWVAMRASRDLDERSGAPVGSGALGPRCLALIAAGLVVMPAVVISLIGRYQVAFGWGNGYSAVYLQSFGVALGFALAIAALLRVQGRRRTWIAVALASSLGVASAGNLANNAAVAQRLDEAWDPQNAWIAMLRSPDLKALCGNVPLLVLEPGPWAERRIITHAGYGYRGIADIEQARRLPGAFEVCVARSARVLGRNGTAFARVLYESGVAGAQMRSPTYLVVPLDAHEKRAQLTLGAECLGAQRHLQVVSDWVVAERRYALFALQPAPEPSSHPAVIALPCE